MGLKDSSVLASGLMVWCMRLGFRRGGLEWGAWFLEVWGNVLTIGIHLAGFCNYSSHNHFVLFLV